MEVHELLEEIVISIIGASIFSYFIVRSMDLFLQEYIKGLPYTPPTSAPLFEHIWFQLWIYAPIGFIILIDAIVFTILIQLFYWPVVRGMTNSVGLRDRLADSIICLLLILPFSFVPWPIQRIFTAIFLENGTIPIHVPPLIIWIVATLVCGGVAHAILRIRKKKEIERNCCLCHYKYSI